MNRKRSEFSSGAEAVSEFELCFSRALKGYFLHLAGHKASNVYPMLLQGMERPMLEIVMEQVGGNQSQAAQVLGISRHTLRKKLQTYGML
jgi:Fis family transcriptional regulator